MLATLGSLLIIQVLHCMALENSTAEANEHLRIVGGVDVDIKDYPYQASLQDRFGHMCGGSIISRTFILTAAHCVNRISPRRIHVRVGSTDHDHEGQLLRVKHIICHENYDESNTDYDIALLELTSKITTKNAQAIKLPPSGNGPADDGVAIVTGWGALHETETNIPDILQKVEVPLIDHDKCRSLYMGRAITDRMFCAGFAHYGGKDACQGDSGGPFVMNGTLYGIVSWGIGCARGSFPGIYTNVPLLKDWITSKSHV